MPCFWWADHIFQQTSKLFQLPCQLKNFVGLNAAPFFWFQEEQKVLFNMFTGH